MKQLPLHPQVFPKRTELKLVADEGWDPQFVRTKVGLFAVLI